MTNVQKQAIVKAIDDKKEQLKSYAAVATFCGISEAAINQIIRGNYQTKGNAMWLKVAAMLKVNLTSSDAKGWMVVDTNDARKLAKVAIDAKNRSLFIAISHPAGSGKSVSLRKFADDYKQNEVYLLRCWDWGKREFMEQLCQNLGINPGAGFKTPNLLLTKVIEFFQQRSLQKPLLIIDEADKLKASALRFLIPLYNELEDVLGVIIAGTENLQKDIKKGVRYATKGYDELDSRFGRRFISLTGASLKDVTRICEANGIAAPDEIKSIFQECTPERKKVGSGEIVQVVNDLRRLKRIIQRQQLINA